MVEGLSVFRFRFQFQYVSEVKTCAIPSTRPGMAQMVEHVTVQHRQWREMTSLESNLFPSAASFECCFQSTFDSACVVVCSMMGVELTGSAFESTVAHSPQSCLSGKLPFLKGCLGPELEVKHKVFLLAKLESTEGGICFHTQVLRAVCNIFQLYKPLLSLYKSGKQSSGKATPQHALFNRDNAAKIEQNHSILPEIQFPELQSKIWLFAQRWRLS